MSKERPTRIQLIDTGRHEEGRAGAAITPGMLIKKASTGKMIPHNGDGEAGQRAFAYEDALQGRTIEDDYAVDELVFYTLASPGDHIYAFLADGEAVDEGDQLTSNGDGRLRKVTGSDAAIAEALEAMDLSESSNVTHDRIRVRVL